MSGGEDDRPISETVADRMQKELADWADVTLDHQGRKATLVVPLPYDLVISRSSAVGALLRERLKAVSRELRKLAEEAAR